MQDENLSPRSLAALIAKRQRGGDRLKSLIAPPTYEFNNSTRRSFDESQQKKSASNQSWTTSSESPTSSTNLKKKPKNHLRANREALKEKQRNIKDIELERTANEKLRLQKLEQKKQKLYGNVRSKILEPTASSPSVHSGRPDSRNNSSMALQLPTVPTRRNIAFGEKAPSPPKYVQSGVTSSSSSSSSSSLNERHKSYGKVPRYITDRKAKIEREEEEMRRLRENAPPAPGLVLLEESERLETIRVLEANEKEARDALLNIPFRMNEQRAARLRQAVEIRLKEIEDTRKIFSKQKVFVTKNDDA
ncbi:hypothetical protein ACHAXA_005297 [Cyclostephanos tholiformis]|uniref:Enkurin domain-containing protein n=1 Tax=Cyclostephanos tholiformis TaxID=382380 RepID=A0ABD3RBF3_9STRA